uniref:Uncharacterized protein n=1 Tax=Manihot esculenta TaxID=3983 RepID=A0A2C9VYY9_MANES
MFDSILALGLDQSRPDHKSESTCEPNQMMESIRLELNLVSF